MAAEITAPRADVLTRRNDVAHTGSIQAPDLDQAAVTNPRWGEIGCLPVRGIVYAQPLVAEQVAMPGGARRDLVFVATGSNGLFSFDVHSFAPVWAQPQLASNDESTIGNLACNPISSPEGIGIEATPTIDRARNTLFLTYRTNASDRDRSLARIHLRAVDLSNGHVLNDVVVMPPNPAPDWTVWHRSRAGLLLQDGIVYVALASRCEDPGTPMFNGRILGYDAATLRQVASFSPTADQGIDGGGIWQGGSGIAAGPEGNLYVATGGPMSIASRAKRPPCPTASSSSVPSSRARRTTACRQWT